MESKCTNCVLLYTRYTVDCMFSQWPFSDLIFIKHLIEHLMYFFLLWRACQHVLPLCYAFIFTVSCDIKGQWKSMFIYMELIGRGLCFFNKFIHSFSVTYLSWGFFFLVVCFCWSGYDWSESIGVIKKKNIQSAFNVFTVSTNIFQWQSLCIWKSGCMTSLNIPVSSHLVISHHMKIPHYTHQLLSWVIYDGWCVLAIRAKLQCEQALLAALMLKVLHLIIYCQISLSTEKLWLPKNTFLSF